MAVTALIKRGNRDNYFLKAAFISGVAFKTPQWKTEAFFSHVRSSELLSSVAAARRPVLVLHRRDEAGPDHDRSF